MKILVELVREFVETRSPGSAFVVGVLETFDLLFWFEVMETSMRFLVALHHLAPWRGRGRILERDYMGELGGSRGDAGFAACVASAGTRYKTMITRLGLPLASSTRSMRSAFQQAPVESGTASSASP